jgi:phytoene dehydrogenase-like protein
MSVAVVDGRVGLPAPAAELAARDWDVVVVGGGHNGLTAAAYLARAGCGVLVLERRDRLGGACTVERPFTDQRFVMSPCAYLVGLLDPVVIDDFALRRAGLRTLPVDPTSWTPFDDGTSLYQWRDASATAASVAALSPGDVDGFARYDALFDRVRDLLRRGPDGDTWDDPAPDAARLDALLADDPEARDVVLHASIADVVEGHVRDDRLRRALHGQGIVGTFAGPREAGTAWVHAHHRLGLLGGWAFVEGGMGQISFLLADAARDAGAWLAAGTPVAAIEPGVGVRLAGGERIRARVVVANADPHRVLDLLGREAPTGFADHVRRWRATSPVVKVNCALSRLPAFIAAPSNPPVHRAQVEIVGSIDETQAGCDAARRGELAIAWCELYFQSVHDPSVAPPGAHTMSVFAQYAPAALPDDGPLGRDRAGDAVLAAVARYAPDVEACVVERQVLTPADVEERVGLSGGHIFQGEILPDQMWDRRFAARTSVPGLYLCGAATHPGGSVMARNGRNAAQAVLRDLGRVPAGART